MDRRQFTAAVVAALGLPAAAIAIPPKPPSKNDSGSSDPEYRIDRASWDIRPDGMTVVATAVVSRPVPCYPRSSSFQPFGGVPCDMVPYFRSVRELPSYVEDGKARYRDEIVQKLRCHGKNNHSIYSEYATGNLIFRHKDGRRVWVKGDCTYKAVSSSDFPIQESLNDLLIKAEKEFFETDCFEEDVVWYLTEEEAKFMASTKEIVNYAAGAPDALTSLDRHNPNQKHNLTPYLYGCKVVVLD